MKTTRLIFAAIIFPIVFLLGCDHGDLRGSWQASPDRKTYLIVADNNGGNCGSIRVDGKKWTYPIGKAGPISPGRHRIECGEYIDFEVRAGTTFKFDYWGP